MPIAKERRTNMLTAKQEAFVQNIIKGMSQADAYRSAYSTKNMADKTIHENASRLANDSKVRARLDELRGQISTENIMTAQKRLEWLTELITSGEESTSDKLKAIDIMNKMTGEYVQKVQAAISYEDSLRKVVDEDEY
jgi:phage terminase small subunit